MISLWSNWTECDKSCGEMGAQTRFRMVLLPASFGGSCELQDGKQMEQRACYNGACSQLVTTGGHCIQSAIWWTYIMAQVHGEVFVEIFYVIRSFHCQVISCGEN